MRQLLERLGVCVIVAATDEVDRRINGASTLAPVPAVLVARQSNDPWVLRMTMAHELGHLLFHAGRFSISPGVPPAQGAWALELDFERRELEADAFAAAFLAPRFAVQDLLQRTGLAPETPGAVAAVGSHFGVGKEVAINRIVDCMGLSMASRVRLRAMTTTWIGHFDADTFSDDETGLHRGELRRAALEAFDKGLLGTLAVREMLAIPPGVTLDGSPEPGFEQQRVQRLMQKLALEQGFSGVVTGVRQAGATWQAELSGPGGERYSMVALRSDERALDRVG
jgi:Zn-dependent peptidase ImmA (M78 family)